MISIKQICSVVLQLWTIFIFNKWGVSRLERTFKVIFQRAIRKPNIIKVVKQTPSKLFIWCILLFNFHYWKYTQMSYIIIIIIILIIIIIIALKSNYYNSSYSEQNNTISELCNNEQQRFWLCFWHRRLKHLIMVFQWTLKGWYLSLFVSISNELLGLCWRLNAPWNSQTLLPLWKYIPTP